MDGWTILLFAGTAAMAALVYLGLVADDLLRATTQLELRKIGLEKAREAQMSAEADDAKRAAMRTKYGNPWSTTPIASRNLDSDDISSVDESEVEFDKVEAHQPNGQDLNSEERNSSSPQGEPPGTPDS